MSEYGEPVVSVVYGGYRDRRVDSLTLTYPSLEGRLPAWYTLDLRTQDLPRLSWGLGGYEAGRVSEYSPVAKILRATGVWVDLPSFLRWQMIVDESTLIGVSVRRSVV
jgi:hypothetical protein